MLLLAGQGLHAQAANDDFDEASPIPAETFDAVFTGNTAGGTVEPGEPSHAGKAPRRSVWWSWRPEYGGKTRIRIEPGSWRRRFAVYRGDFILSLVPVGSASGSPYEVQFDAVGGEPYAIAFDEISGASGQTFPFSWSLRHRTMRLAPPTGVYQEGDSIPLSVQAYDPSLTFLWVDYLANGTGVGSAAEPPWTLDWGPVGAQSYEVSAVGTDVFGEAHPADPVAVLVGSRNDAFDSAPVLDLVEGTNTLAVITTYATAEPGEPAHGLVVSAVRSLWWRWTPPWDGQALVTIREFGSLHGAALYTGDAVDRLTADPSVRPVAGGLVFDVTAGRTYRLAVEGGFSTPDLGCEVVIYYSLLRARLPEDGFAATLPGRIVAEYSRAGSSPGEVTFLTARDLGWGSFETPQAVGTSTTAPFRVDWTPPLAGVYELSLRASFADGTSFEAVPVRFQVAVANDHFAGAQVLTGPVGARYSNGLGGAETGEPSHAGQPPVQTQWWQWTAPTDGKAYMSVSAWNSRRALAVYTGASLHDLTLVADNRPRSGSDPLREFEFRVTQGQTYRVAMGLWPGEPALETDWGLDFWTFFLSQPDSMRFVPLGQPVALEALLFDPPSLTNTWGADVALLATKWMQNPDFEKHFTSPPYRATWVPTAPGLYRVAGGMGMLRTHLVYVDVMPENDAFDAPTRFEPEGCVWVAHGDSAGSTLEPGETPLDPTDGSIWFEWTPPADGPIAVYMMTGSQNRTISFYEGKSLTDLTPIAESYAQNWFRASARRGVPLRVGVRSYHAPGMLTEDNGSPLDIRLYPLALNDTFARAQALVLQDTQAGYAMGRFGFTNVHTLEGYLWWNWTAPTDGDLWVETSEPGDYGHVSLQTGDSATNLVWAYNYYASLGRPARIVARAGTTYRLAMLGSSPGAPVCQPVDAWAVFVAHPTRPANDDFVRRTALAGERVDLAVTMANATAEPNEPETTDATLWWSYTAPRAGILTVTASANGYQPAVQVFRGDRLDALQAAGWGNPALVETPVQAGETLQIRLSEPPRSFFSPLGPAALHLELATPAAPPNDDYAHRIALTGSRWVQTGRIDGATFEPGEFAWTSGATLWWTFTAPADGVFRLRVAEAEFGGHLTSYYDGSFPDLFPRRGRFEGMTELWVDLTAGSTLPISLESLDRLRGAFTLTGEFLSAPDNDAFAQRQRLEGRHVLAEGFNAGASAEPGEPVHGTNTIGASLWWTWTAPSAGPVELANDWWTPLAFAVYEGSGLTMLRRVEAVESTTGSVRFEAVAGRTYAIAVDATAPQLGYMKFRLDMRNPPSVRGRLAFGRQLQDGSIQWRHEGEVGYRYQVEWKVPDGPWQPLTVLDQAAGTVEFRDELRINEKIVLYRTRGLD